MQPPSLWYQSHPYRHHHPDITTPAHRVTTLQGMEAYTMQAKRGAGSRHTSRNIGGRVTHHAKEKKPPQATEGGQCAIGVQPPSLVTLATHTDIDTSTHQVTTLQGSEAGCSTTHQAAALTLVTLATHTDIITSSHRAITLQGNEAGCSTTHR